MAYRATLDASHKLTRKGGHHKKFVRHIARDVDRARGVVHPMSNENIDWVRTQHNRTMVTDGNGGFRPATSSVEIIDALELRLSDVQHQRMPNGSLRAGIRSNSVVARPLVFGMARAWYDEYSPGWQDGSYSVEAERLHAVIEAWAITEFGAQNVPGFSWHCDESLPAQLQLIFVPVTDDGRLNQGAFFTGRTHLRDLGGRFRKHLVSEGYDIELAPSKRSREHLDSDEFQQRADQLRESQEKATAEAASLFRREVVQDAEDELREHRRALEDGDRDELHEVALAVLHEREASIPKLRAAARHKGQSAGFQEGQATWESEVRPRFEAQLTARLQQLRDEDEEKLTAAKRSVAEKMQQVKAQRDALMTALRMLEAFKSEKLRNGQTVGQMLATLMKQAARKIEPHHTAPPPASRQRGNDPSLGK